MMFYILCLLMVIIGVILLFKPATWAELLQIWTEKTVKLTPAQAVLIRVVGAICVIIAIAYIVLTWNAQ